MLPRRPACRRAAHCPNPALPLSDSIWISDSLLLSTFTQFFALSKGTRRHGSFVPGPLECRRRMGKRRMAYRSDAIPPIFGTREPWGWLGDMDNLSWRWQAPTSSTTRSAQKDIIITLPRWLAGWPFGPNIPPSTVLETEVGRLPKDATFEKENLLEFQQTLHNSDSDKSEICSQFNHYLRQSITIGSVDEDLLRETLSLVTKEIHWAFGDATVAASQKLAFYQAVWEGLSSCKILLVDTFQATTMDHLLGLISALPVSLQTRALARGILTSVSMSQLEEMNSSIQNLVRSWMLSWLAKTPIQDYETLMVASKDAVDASEIALRNSEALHAAIWERRGTTSDVTTARQALNQLRGEIISGIKSIKKCEAALYPVRSSILDLANCIQRVPPDSLHSIITSCSNYIAKLYQADNRGRLLAGEMNIRVSMLSLVAQLPNASREIFVQTWRAMDTKDWRIPEDLGSDLILSHMVSQGYIKDPAGLRNIFEALPARPTLKEYGFLLVALQKEKKDWSGAKYLIGLLNELNKQWSVHKALTIARNHRMVPPVEHVRAMLNAVAIGNPRIAFNIYNMYVPYTYNIKKLDLSQCSDFVISMIHDDLIPPEKIWKVLGISIYKNLRKSDRYRSPSTLKSSLSPEHVELITSMATAFSRSKARPQRVSFRNVSQCLSHLQRHGVPVSAEMSRAISYSGITREILRQNWIGEQRLRWILDVVEAGEGRQVKNRVEAAVGLWRRQVEKTSINTRHLRVKQAEEST